MNPQRRVVHYIAWAVGVLLCGVGILHDILNVRSVTRAITRGEIGEKMGARLVANVVLAGVALVLLGLFLLIVAADLQRGKRLAWRVALVVGFFYPQRPGGILVAAHPSRLDLLRLRPGPYHPSAPLAKTLPGGIGTSEM